MEKDVDITQGEAKPVKQHWLVRGTHFVANFIGIGWVLNAIVSVEVFKAIEKFKPEWLLKSYAETEKLLTKITSAAGLYPTRKTTLPNAAKDLVVIAALGIGGFMVLPLQKLYAAHRVKISRKVEGMLGREGSTSTAQSEESVESTSHWIAARVVAFSAACSLYMVLKYFVPKQYERMNKYIVGLIGKAFPGHLAPNSKTTEYYVAEQIATVTSVATLATLKTTLDKLFPPKRGRSELAGNADQKRKKIIAEGPKAFTTRAEAHSQNNSASLA